MFSFNEAGLSQEKNLNNVRANIFFVALAFRFSSSCLCDF
jgi:hypothetical protein